MQENITDLLDVGCGNGIFSSIVKKKTGCKLIGIDGNKHALEVAQKSEIGFDETLILLMILIRINYLSMMNPLVLLYVKMFWSI